MAKKKDLKEVLYRRLEEIIWEGEECERKAEALKEKVMNPRVSLDDSRQAVIDYHIQKATHDTLIRENHFLRSIL